MFAPANQPRFTLTFDSGPNDLKVLEFKGKEAISQPYCFDLELISERPDLALEDLLHRQAYLGFDHQGRGIHGQVYSVAQGDSGKRLTRYHITLVPRLAYLRHRINQRIFQHLSVPDIVARVLKDHAILADAYQFSLGGKYPERDYCVQYSESDLAFIERICAEVGIHYHFQHSPDGHLLVFGDDQTMFRRLPESTLYLPGTGMAADEPAIKRLAVRLQTRTTAVTLRDYDFRKPGLSLQVDLDNQQLPALESYHYPGQYIDRDDGKHLVRRALERQGIDHRLAEGDSDDCAFASGHFMRIQEHPRAQWNDLWLLTRIDHRGRQPQVLEETASAGPDEFQGYSNTFLATPWDVFFRPPLQHGKPSVNGYQPAVVTGPVDSEIHCDAFGRVKVQLAWDRDGERDEHSSCWLRVATGWAHDRYGSVMIPRVGMEVLVGFMEGDVDKPLIVGCLPNGANPVPLDLPADKTRSILRSQSSPGGGGYNELRIEDRKGAEEIYLRAQRNWTQHVLHDQRVQVDHERSIVVTGTARHELKADEQRLTQGRRQVEIRQDDHLLVTGDRHIRVANQAVSAAGGFHVSAGQQIVLEAGASATVQAGGHWINIGPGGIFSSVPIQVGGAPMVAMDANPVAPGAPEKLAAAPAPRLSHAQIQSLKSPAPFCEECERCKDGACDLPPPGGQPKRQAPVPDPAKSVEPGFHIVERAMPRSELERWLFAEPGVSIPSNFSRLNPQLGDAVKPGQLIVLSDPQNSQCTREEALLMEAAQKVNEALASMSDDEADFMALHHGEIESFLTRGSTSVGIGAAMFGQHLGSLKSNMVELEQLHQRTFDKHGKLQGADFFAERKRLMGQIDNSLGPLVRKGTGIPNHPKLKSALGISNRSLVHHWSKAGVAGGIPGYATHIEGVSRASKYIKAGGWIGIGLGAAASGLKVKETCRVGSAEACERVKFMEAGKFGVGVAGGAFGSAAGLAVCTVIGLGTAGVGGVVCGLVAVGLGAAVGGELGGKGGEYLGEKIYEVQR